LTTSVADVLAPAGLDTDTTRPSRVLDVTVLIVYLQPAALSFARARAAVMFLTEGTRHVLAAPGNGRATGTGTGATTGAGTGTGAAAGAWVEKPTGTLNGAASGSGAKSP
jgi:hypothetical protein